MPEKPILEQLLPWMTIIAAFGGALITGLIAIVISIINKRSEERKHMRELMLHTALEHFKTVCDATPGQDIFPLEAWIIHLLKISDVFLDAKITKENVINKLKEAYAVSDMVTSFIGSKNDKHKAESTLKKDTPNKPI